jgi:hypothetical protein
LPLVAGVANSSAIGAANDGIPRRDTDANTPSECVKEVMVCFEVAAGQAENKLGCN